MLTHAAETGNLSECKKLVEMGAKSFFSNMNSVHVAAREGHLEVVRYLLESGVPQDVNGFAISDATRRGHVEVALLLLDNGADLNYVSCHAIENAATTGNLELLRTYLSEGADVEHNDGSPLAYAAGAGQLEACEILLEAGAKPTPRALMEARNQERWAAAALLVERGAKFVTDDFHVLLKNLLRFASPDALKARLSEAVDVAAVESVDES